MVFMTYTLNGKKIELVHRTDGWVDLVLSFLNDDRHPYIVPVGVMIHNLTGCPVSSLDPQSSSTIVVFKPIMYRLDDFIDNLLSRDV